MGTLRSLKPQASLPAEGPVDPAAGHANSGDLQPDPALQRLVPWHETEAQPVIDNREASAGQLRAASQLACELVAGCHGLPFSPLFRSHRAPDTFHFPALQTLDEVARGANATVPEIDRIAARHQHALAAVHRLACLGTKAGLPD